MKNYNPVLNIVTVFKTNHQQGGGCWEVLCSWMAAREVWAEEEASAHHRSPGTLFILVLRGCWWIQLFLCADFRA